MNGGYAPTGPNRTISHRKTNGLTINLNIFTYFNTHTFSADKTEEMQRIDGTEPGPLPGGRTIEAILASARVARARLPAAREGPGPDAAAAAAADAVRVAGRRATKPRSAGGARATSSWADELRPESSMRCYGPHRRSTPFHSHIFTAIDGGGGP